MLTSSLFTLMQSGKYSQCFSILLSNASSCHISLLSTHTWQVATTEIAPEFVFCLCV